MRKARELDDAKRELDLKVEEKVQASLAKVRSISTSPILNSGNTSRPSSKSSAKCKPISIASAG